MTAKSNKKVTVSGSVGEKVTKGEKAKAKEKVSVGCASGEKVVKGEKA